MYETQMLYPWRGISVIIVVKTVTNMKFKYSYLFLSDCHSAVDILPQKIPQNNSLSALIRANSPETLFPDDSFVNQNTLGNRNGLFRSASDFYSQETLPSLTLS